MVKKGPVRIILDFAARLLTGRGRMGWSKVELVSGRGTVKNFSMLDGMPSKACVAKGFMAVYGESAEGRDFRPLKPMHVLLEVSFDNLLRFYPPEYAREIQAVYNRMNRIYKSRD